MHDDPHISTPGSFNHSLLSAPTFDVLYSAGEDATAGGRWPNCTTTETYMHFVFAETAQQFLNLRGEKWTNIGLQRELYPLNERRTQAQESRFRG